MPVCLETGHNGAAVAVALVLGSNKHDEGNVSDRETVRQTLHDVMAFLRDCQA